MSTYFYTEVNKYKYHIYVSFTVSNISGSKSTYLRTKIYNLAVKNNAEFQVLNFTAI